MPKIDKTGDAAIMPLHKILMRMCGQTGYTPDAVFEGLLDYIIGYLNPSLTTEPIEGWKFKPQVLSPLWQGGGYKAGVLRRAKRQSRAEIKQAA